MPDSMATPPESDIRFQFEVIKNLAESVRQQSEVLRGVQTTQITMLERLARIESNRINETVSEIKVTLEGACKAIDKLEKDRDVREGTTLAWRSTMIYWPVIAVTISAFLWIARVAGILHLPTDPPAVRS